jgi:hypothetical protein
VGSNPTGTATKNPWLPGVFLLIERDFGDRQPSSKVLLIEDLPL